MSEAEDNGPWRSILKLRPGSKLGCYLCNWAIEEGAPVVMVRAQEPGGVAYWHAECYDDDGVADRRYQAWMDAHPQGGFTAEPLPEHLAAK